MTRMALAQMQAKYRTQLDEKNPPAHVRDTIEKEIDRMLKIPVTSPRIECFQNLYRNPAFPAMDRNDRGIL